MSFTCKVLKLLDFMGGGGCVLDYRSQNQIPKLLDIRNIFRAIESFNIISVNSQIKFMSFF